MTLKSGMLCCRFSQVFCVPLDAGSTMGPDFRPTNINQYQSSARRLLADQWLLQAYKTWSVCLHFVVDAPTPFDVLLSLQCLRDALKSEPVKDLPTDRNYRSQAFLE